MQSKVAVKFCPSYDLDKLQSCLEGSLSLLGGVSAFLKPGERVLVKPNLVIDAEPEKGITTHPNFVQAVVKILKKNGLEVAIADIPGEQRLAVNLEKVYQVTGMNRVAKEEGVRLLTEATFIEEDGVIFSSWMREFDHLVSLPKFKTHALTILTGAVKNIFGLTPRLYRMNLHRKFFQPQDFAGMLLGVYRKCRPTLSLVDGIVAMDGNGPASGGNLKNLGLVAISNDALALDSILAYLMGLKPQDIPTIRQGRLQGLGETNLGEIEVTGDGLESFLTADFRLPPTFWVSQLPGTLLAFLIKRFARSRPRVHKFNCNGCRICVENCPLLAIEIQNKKAQIDYQKCVDCFCCLEVCPNGAMKMKSGPLLRAYRFLQHLKALAKR